MMQVDKDWYIRMANAEANCDITVSVPRRRNNMISDDEYLSINGLLALALLYSKEHGEEIPQEAFVKCFEHVESFLDRTAVILPCDPPSPEIDELMVYVVSKGPQE